MDVSGASKPHLCNLKAWSRCARAIWAGDRPNPTYEQVCTGVTGHVEVAEITFDPAKISYRDLLDVFFTVHDPTTLNRQGNDVGEQYRSVIFYLDESQKKTAEDVIAEWTRDKVFSDPIVTAVEPAQTFYVAEDYHQDYFKNHPLQPYCMFTVAPKVKKVRQKFAATAEGGGVTKIVHHGGHGEHGGIQFKVFGDLRVLRGK